MASFDVVSLYTSIDHTRGIQAVKNALERSDLSTNCKQFLIDLLTLNLTCNYFSFDKMFLQIRGTAMGANVANVFVVDMKEGSIYNSHHFCHALKWW